MEDVLDVYTRPRDASTPLVCMDESPRQLIGETRQPLPPKPGASERYDTEYVRHGVAELFMFTAPLEGWRRVTVTERRTKQDWARQIKRLVDEDFPEAERIVLVMDNLNTHKLGSLYATFPAEEAHRIRSKLEIHYTPKHGSWLNMAEIELSVLHRHGLSDRIGSIDQLEREAAAWEARRNLKARTINWQFTAPDARISLRRLYPQFGS